MDRLVRLLTRPSRFPMWLRVLAAAALGAGALLGPGAPPSPASGTPTSSSQGSLLPLTKQNPSNGFDLTLATRLAAMKQFQSARHPNIPRIISAATKLPFGPGPGDPVQRFPDSSVYRAEGYLLYHQSCASCHGLNLQGIKGVAPSLIGVGAGPTAFYLTTGRMPLANPHQEPERAKAVFTTRQIDAIVDYVASYGGPPAPTADPARGDLGVGQQQFTLNCAGCHQELARGGMTVGAFVPDLMKASPQQIAEAVRFGPYLMPHFDYHQIDQYQLDSLARYITYARSPDNAGGWGIYNIGPIPEGLVAWFMGLLAMGIVARLIGERAG